MAGDVLRFLLRKKATYATKGGRGSAPPKRIGRAVMIERRDRCMSEVVRLRSSASASGALADKAYRLLTTHWAASSWRARSDILRSAEWLLGISRKVTGAPTPAGRTESNRNSRSEPREAQQHLNAVSP